MNSRQTGLESSLEKFVVIEGNNRIYQKIAQMIKNIKYQFFAIAPFSGLMRDNEFGLFDAAFEHPLKSTVQFRFITELSDKNVNTIKTLLKRTLKARVNVKGCIPNLGLRLFPRMVIRDDEEILFFIKPTADTFVTEVCLWTNCKALVQAFTAVFEDLWHNSTDMQTEIMRIETGKPTSETCIIKDAEVAYKKYVDTVRSAQEEIVMMISSEDLLRSWKNMSLLKKRAERGVSTKIMAPITSENLQVAQELSKFCTVKHVNAGYLGTTIIDGKHLFQFRDPPPEQEHPKNMAYFESIFYSNDHEYVEKMKNMLSDIWESACVPSIVTLESILGLV